MAICRAQISLHNEPVDKPVGLVMQGGKHLNGATRKQTALGEMLLSLTTSLTHISTFTSAEADAAVQEATSFKESKYTDISSAHMFYSATIETAGACDV